jgi:hypothetical protein
MTQLVVVRLSGRFLFVELVIELVCCLLRLQLMVYWFEWWGCYLGIDSESFL